MIFIIVFLITFFVTLEYADSRNRRRFPRYKGWLDGVIELEGNNFLDQNIANQSRKIWADKKDRELLSERKHIALDNTLWLESQGYKFPWYRLHDPIAPVVVPRLKP